MVQPQGPPPPTPRVRVENIGCVSVQTFQHNTWTACNISCKNMTAGEIIADRLNALLKEVREERYPILDEALVDKWKTEVYLKAKEIDPSDQYHWESLATGFFMAHGRSNVQAYDLYQKCIKQGCF